MFLQKSLLSILQRVHCSSTHHYFALDALPVVQTPAGKRLVRVLLRHHRRYLLGATDPDTRFRDYQNHVIHVKDGYWGGAPRMAHKWYDRMQRYLRTNRFSDAAHAAGVLSHYFTDPFQPLHTEHSELEKVLHRPIEQSIYQAYAEIYQLWRRSQMEVIFQLSNRVSWLGESMLHGSHFANQKFDVLLDQYDLISSVGNPRKGLSVEAKNSLAEIFGLAITGWARVLERAAQEAEHDRKKKLPVHLVSPSMLTSACRAPLGWVKQYLGARRDQKEIIAMIGEYANQGKLVRQIPAEIDIVHRVADIYQSEKAWRPPQLSGDTQVAVNWIGRADQSERKSIGESTDSPTKVRELSAKDSVFSVPFIPACAAQRMVEVGVERLRDLLHDSPGELKERMKLDGVTTQILTRWQSQATLMVKVKGLGEQASMWLVAAGYTSAESIAMAKRSSIHQAVRNVIADQADKGLQHHRVEPGLYPRSSEINCWIALASAQVEFSQRRSA
ncbi:MAG: hypothetical protein CMM01_16510 [Rhodopirellula sp.]|nr:hypothetical protein [Rhodopirellula sp.]OUX50268.1 MAG: hypothetical protein CBE43_07540 [Rhodopirellula sp. TMED283]